MSEPKFITEFKGDYRVQYWKPLNSDGWQGHNVYYFDDETEAKAKYIELVIRQTFHTMDLDRVVFEALYDYGGEDRLAFVKVLESRR